MGLAPTTDDLAKQFEVINENNRSIEFGTIRDKNYYS